MTYANSQNPTAERHFHYDTAYPRLTAFDNGQGQTALNYIPAGYPGADRLAQEIAPDSYWVERNYDILGRLQTNTVVDPGNTSYPNTLGYDALGRLTENVTGLGVFQYAYDHDSQRLAQLIYPNQTRESLVYHDVTSDLRLKTLNHYRPDGTLFANHRYSYDAEGQISQWQRQDPATVREHYQYDAIGQLLQVAGATFYIPAIPAIPQGNGQPPIPAVPAHRLDNVTLAYAYAADNRIRETIGSQSSDAVYNNLNQLLTNGNDSYSHDLEGNQSQRQSPTLGNRRTLWDAENRLIAVEDPQNPASRNDFQYDALGRRIGVQDKNNGAITQDWRLVYCGTTLCAEENQSTGSFSRYYGDGAAKDGQGSYYHRDHLGSVRAVTGSTGTVKASYAYDPYGRRTVLTGNADDSAFGFTGHYVHQATGLAFAPYRAYDANIGRWISRDPIGEEGGD